MTADGTIIVVVGEKNIACYREKNRKNNDFLRLAVPVMGRVSRPASVLRTVPC